MIKLRAEFSDENLEVSLQRSGASVSAEIEGRHYNLEVRDLGQNEYLIKDGDRVYDCRVFKSTSGKDVCQAEVHLRGASYAIRLTDPKRLRSAQSGRTSEKGLAQILAPMPGKVVRVLTEVGAEVQAGAGILIVEAMKMQNEMKAPKAGRVVSISAEAGATVNAGDVLAVIE
jgi:biotin carboxyl carrier protein